MRIVPPVFWFLGIGYVLLIKAVDPFIGYLPAAIKWLGLGAFTLSVIPVITTIFKFSQLRTQIHTFKKPARLSVSGWFRLSRNPIYLSQTISLIGLSVFVTSPLGLLAPLIFFILCHFHYIPFEENNLERVFGQEYMEYKSRVRRWL